MARAQKPDFVFRRNGRVSAGASVQSTTGSRGVRISGSNAGYTTFQGSVKGTGYPLRSPVSPSLPLPASPCAITFQLESTDEYGAMVEWRLEGENLRDYEHNLFQRNFVHDESPLMK